MDVLLDTNLLARCIQPSHHQVVWKHAHDTRLVAAMNVHGFPAIATFNARDFARYPGIQVLSPEDLAVAWTARAVGA